MILALCMLMMFWIDLVPISYSVSFCAFPSQKNTHVFSTFTLSTIDSNSLSSVFKWKFFDQIWNLFFWPVMQRTAFDVFLVIACVCLCVCVCEREREREKREKKSFNFPLAAYSHHFLDKKVDLQKTESSWTTLLQWSVI